jgi:hypothetical protein
MQADRRGLMEALSRSTNKKGRMTMELIWIALFAVDTVLAVVALGKSIDSEGSGGSSDAGAS